jgi:putative aminopeptidase FrvX
VAGTFVRLVQIKGISGQEEHIREEVKHILTTIGARELPLARNEPDAPLNLLMEIPATGRFTNKPAILLNAHLDTVAWTTPERMAFEPTTGDFFHLDENTPGETSSFGGDDRTGVTVIVEAVSQLQTEYWRRGVDHRRVVLLFTAKEERGCLGARYLRDHQPDVFANLDISLSIDGPLDLRSDYPRDSFVAVVSDRDAGMAPYGRVLELMNDYCVRTKHHFGRTEVGLGLGDFAHFPGTAHAGLHLRSPVRGWHNQERVKLDDVIHHVDLLCFLLLAWDHSLPDDISPESMLSEVGLKSDR